MTQTTLGDDFDEIETTETDNTDNAITSGKSKDEIDAEKLKVWNHYYLVNYSEGPREIATDRDAHRMDRKEKILNIGLKTTDKTDVTSTGTIYLNDMEEIDVNYETAQIRRDNLRDVDYINKNIKDIEEHLKLMEDTVEEVIWECFDRIEEQIPREAPITDDTVELVEEVIDELEAESKAKIKPRETGCVVKDTSVEGIGSMFKVTPFGVKFC